MFNVSLVRHMSSKICVILAHNTHNSALNVSATIQHNIVALLLHDIYFFLIMKFQPTRNSSVWCPLCNNLFFSFSNHIYLLIVVCMDEIQTFPRMILLEHTLSKTVHRLHGWNTKYANNNPFWLHHLSILTFLIVIINMCGWK